MIDEWRIIKESGSGHYKGGQIEPIDLMKGLKPHESLDALSIKGLLDNIKYSYRMLTKGANVKDCEKSIHYMKMVKYLVAE